MLYRPTEKAIARILYVVGGKRYTEGEVEEILKVALQGTHSMGDMDRSSLEAAAAEMGISPETLAAAEQEVLSRRQDGVLFEKFKKIKWNAFMGHIGTYLAVNAGLAFMFQFPRWQIWVLGGWGIGVLTELFNTLAATRPGSPAFEVWKRLQAGENVSGIQLASVEKDLVLAEYVKQGGLRERLSAAQHLRSRTGLSSDEALEAVDEFRERHPNVLA